MSKGYWRSEGRSEAQRILDSLIGSGQPYEWLHAPVEELKLRALAASISRSWPSGDKVRWSSLRLCINTVVLQGKRSLEDLERAMDMLWDDFQRSNAAPKRPFRVVIALDFEPGMGVQLPVTIRSSGIELSLKPFTTAEECLGRPVCSPNQELTKESVGAIYAMHGPKPLAFAEAAYEAPDETRCLNAMMDAFTLWRSAINFVAGSFELGIQFVPQARAVLPPPRWVAAIDSSAGNRLHAHRLILPGDAEPHVRDISADRFHFTAGILKELGGDAVEGSTSGLTLDGIRLYGLSMDQPRWYLATMVLWQLAELLTLIDGQRDRHDEVCRRLVLLGSQDDAQTRKHKAAALRDIMELRHGIVHRAQINSVDGSDVGFLDRCCKDALWWLIKHHAKFPRAVDLKVYLRHGLMSEPDLDRIRHVLGQMPSLKDGADESGILADGPPPQPDQSPIAAVDGPSIRDVMMPHR